MYVKSKFENLGKLKLKTKSGIFNLEKSDAQIKTLVFIVDFVVKITNY